MAVLDPTSDEEAVLDPNLRSEHESEDESGDNAEGNDNGEEEDDQHEEEDDQHEEEDDAEDQRIAAGAVADPASTSEDEEPTLKETSQSTRVRIAKNGETKYWMEHSRQQIVNCAPSAGKVFILYLPLSPSNIGAKHMIDSDINLQELALQRGGPEQYSKDMAKTFNDNHRKAKTQLNRSIVIGLSAPLSKF